LHNGKPPPDRSGQRKARRPRAAIASLRKEQIVEAAVAIIVEQGLQKLSLSEIEQKAGMCRGQLTYYFPAKEDILLAVFDRLLLLMYQRVGTPADRGGDLTSGWDWVKHLLEKLLTQPPVSPDFGCLQYTFLSQIAHREDYRQRLADLYEQWRSNMAAGLADDLRKHSPRSAVSPRAVATLVQALLHGLGMQRAADPTSFDGAEMLELCLDVLSRYLWDQPWACGKRKPAAKKAPAPPNPSKGRRLASQPATQEVNGERTHG
jgi:AcrR family transcriptional regulator